MHRTKYFLCILISLLFLSPAHASPGRTVVIHNNTNATLLVHVGDNEPIELAPLSKKSLFNSLRRGLNRISIQTKYDLRAPGVVRDVWVTGKESKRHSLEVFPRDFGKTAMFDPPGNTEKSRFQSPIVGVWQWCVNGDVTFYEDGTLVQGPRRGKWVKYGDKVSLTWSHGFTDVLTLSADERELKGEGYPTKNPAQKHRVWGRKKSP